MLYNGSQRWTSPTDVFDLIPPTPGLVAQFKPKAKYLLIDENAYSDSELASIKTWWPPSSGLSTRPHQKKSATCSAC